MKSQQKKWRYTAVVALIMFSLSGPTYAIQGPRYEDLKQGPERLLETGETVIGQPIKYPSVGVPKITALIVTVAPGEKNTGS